jgi:hypothetical protein
MILVITLVLPLAARAAAVGHFVQVEGEVDVLRQGKLPAVPAKVQDRVEPGDVIRTKSKSRAQLKFVDDSVLTLAPESRLSVADFVFEPASNTRRAMLKFFRGMIHLVVSRHLQLEQPDFLIQTLTAVIGVRGTETYSLQKPNSTLVYLIRGLLEVKSINPDLPAVLLLQAMHFTEVPLNQQPRLAKPITPADLEMLKKMMITGVTDSLSFQSPLLQAPGTAQGFPLQRLPESPELRIMTPPPPAYGAGPASPAPTPAAPAPAPAPAPSHPGGGYSVGP